MRARTTQSLPKGKILEDYDNPVEVTRTGRKSQAPKELQEVLDSVASGNRVVKVPEGRRQFNFILSLRKWFARRDKNVQVCRIGDDELYVKVKGEEI